jgi:hypothetical protein
MPEIERAGHHTQTSAAVTRSRVCTVGGRGRERVTTVSQCDSSRRVSSCHVTVRASTMCTRVSCAVFHPRSPVWCTP